MTPSLSIQTIVIFCLLFLASKLASCLIYQACWSNSIGRDLKRDGPVWSLMSRFTLWPIHAVGVFLAAQLSWRDLPELHQVSVVSIALLTLGAVFRFGAADVRNFFFPDRMLALVLAVGVFFSPTFMYPAVLVCCCLQYTVSSWPLSPGYSNLLGFEFVRGSCCALLACVFFCGAVAVFSIPVPDFGSGIFLAVVIAVQASSYLNHAVAKSALGPKWYSWILDNRIECLVVNSYLRGWATGMGQATLLRLASFVARYRLLLTGAAWMLEAGFPLVLLDRKLAVVFYLVAATFHVGVFVMTGLAEVEYVVNHLNLSILILVGGSQHQADVFGSSLFMASLPLFALAAIWVGWLRLRILAQRRAGETSSAMRLADPFDHLMAWWDSPYMRMYSYSVQTADGKRKSIAVPKLSPYDTFLTDIHTHMMLLDAHPDFDPQAELEKEHVRSGVWGMVITDAEREMLYGMMDRDSPELSVLKPSEMSEPWRLRGDDSSPESRVALRELFAGFNEFRARKWFRVIMHYPHFPGEDLVPDCCPLIARDVPRYTFDEDIEEVSIERIKTFYSGKDIALIERSIVGTIEVKSPCDVAGERKD